MLGPVKFTVFAMVAAVLASGCGRYEGIPDREPAVHSTLDIDYDQPVNRDSNESPNERTLRVIVRDVDQSDVYDENCRLFAPPSATPEWFSKFGDKLEVSPAGTDPGKNASHSTLALPVNARKVRDGCEAPGLLVTMPYAEEYSAEVVPMVGNGILDPNKPIYPHTFHVPAMATEVVTLVLFQ